jgi:hypothetical protein
VNNQATLGTDHLIYVAPGQTGQTISDATIGGSQVVGSTVSTSDVVLDDDGAVLAYSTTGQTVVTLTAPGANTWTVPAGVTSVEVETWGAGGGSEGSPVNGYGGCGGGGGEYAKETVTVVPGTVIPYSIGAGGTAGPNTGAAAGAGGDTNWNNGQVVAHGGLPGGAAGAGISVGGGTGSTNTIHFDGGKGHSAGGTYGAYGGGGGASGGSSRSGTDGGAPSTNAGGLGGAAVKDGGKGGDAAPGLRAGPPTVIGFPGLPPGGGAGGCGGGSGSPAVTGQAGAAGKIRLTYGGAKVLVASIAGTAGQDDYGNSYPAGEWSATPPAVGNDVPWTPLAYLSPWADYGAGYDPGMYCKRNGIVYIRGLIKNTASITNSSNVATMPVGCRVNVTNSYVYGSGANGVNTVHRLLITAAGLLRVEFVTPASGTGNFIVAGSYVADA